MKLSVNKTGRGFDVIEFKDLYGSECSIQKSSLAREDAIWVGTNDANPMILASTIIDGGTGWVKCPVPEGAEFTTRMHLSREQVEAITPILQRFVETGEIIAAEGE